jgi:diacylglycerol kinase
MRRFIYSFGYAFRGIRLAFSRESNCRIQLLLGLGAVLLSWGLGLSPTEWALVVLCIALVIGAEMINSAIEKTCDRITQEREEPIRTIKDLAAGAVLWISLGSAVVGALLFIPKIIKIFI